MLPCREIVRILSSHEEISWMRRAELRMHLLMCKHCSRYAAHLKMMRDGFSKLFSQITQADKVEIQRLENEIIEKLPKTPAGK